MADVKGMMADPDFQKLDPASQRQALGKLDPDIGGLSDADYQTFRQRMQSPAAEPTPLQKGINAFAPGLHAYFHDPKAFSNQGDTFLRSIPGMIRGLGDFRQGPPIIGPAAQEINQDIKNRAPAEAIGHGLRAAGMLLGGGGGEPRPGELPPGQAIAQVARGVAEAPANAATYVKAAAPGVAKGAGMAAGGLGTSSALHAAGVPFPYSHAPMAALAYPGFKAIRGALGAGREAVAGIPLAREEAAMPPMQSEFIPRSEAVTRPTPHYGESAAPPQQPFTVPHAPEGGGRPLTPTPAAAPTAPIQMPTSSRDIFVGNERIPIERLSPEHQELLRNAQEQLGTRAPQGGRSLSEQTESATQTELPTKATGLQRHVENAMDVAQNMANLMKEKGIHTADINAIEGSPGGWEHFWKQMGLQPGIAKTAGYMPDAHTIQAARQILRESER